MSRFNVIGFDADDTLWENEIHYQLTQSRFQELLANYADPKHLSARLLAAERRNLGHYGYGIKGFTLSMIETAIEVTNGKAPAEVIKHILDAGRDLHSHPTDLLLGAEETVRTLSETYKVVLITKGDLFDQERKLAQSGLGEMFDAVEIVSEKTADSYARIFAPFGGPARAIMAGNSLKSDVIPMIEADGWGVFVPSQANWEMEAAPEPLAAPRYRRIENLTHLSKLVAELEG